MDDSNTPKSPMEWTQLMIHIFSNRSDSNKNDKENK